MEIFWVMVSLFIKCFSKAADYVIRYLVNKAGIKKRPRFGITP